MNCSLFATLSAILFSSVIAHAAELSAADLEFFEKHIRPVLSERCYSCHSAEALRDNKLKGGLQLDTREGIRAGGESGPAVVPGNVEDSLLIAALRPITLAAAITP